LRKHSNSTDFFRDKSTFLRPTRTVHYIPAIKIHYLYKIQNFKNKRRKSKMNRFIKIGKDSIEVTEEVYEAYYKMDRHARYLENDVKVGSSKIDQITGKVKYQPSKEDSIERLMDKGTDFADEKSVEDIVCDKAMLFILQKAMQELEGEELEIIDALYYKNLTTREAGDRINKSHVTVGKKHKKVLDKLKKYFL
jgi:RNA polymerase sigma factor (sigma-70 family)